MKWAPIAFLSLFLFLIIFYYVYISGWDSGNMWTWVHAHSGLKKSSNLLDLELKKLSASNIVAGNQTQILCKSSTLTTELPLQPFLSHHSKWALLTKVPTSCAAFGMGLIPSPQGKSLLPQFSRLPHCALMGVNRIDHFRTFYQFRTYI